MKYYFTIIYDDDNGDGNDDESVTLLFHFISKIYRLILINIPVY